MLREYLEKGKIWADKIASAVMNYTDLENKVREATSDEPWGPHGKVLNDLTRETHDTGGLLEIMTMLLNRIFNENPNNWRRTYKGLVVLAHLLRNGSERVCDIARDNIYNLRSLEGFQYIDEGGLDQGSSVRIKAHEVVELIQDSEFLQAERQKALSIQKTYSGMGSSHFGESNYSGNYRMSNDDNGANDFDRRNSNRFSLRAAPQAEMPWRGERKSDDWCATPSSPNRLGSFESWKGARERTIVDDVAGKFSDVLKAAKAVTNDFFGKPKVPPPSMYEEDPHKVSEEVISFPEEKELNTYQRTSSPSHFSSSTRTYQKASPSPTSPILIDFDLPAAGPHVASPSRLPRPPSTEILTPPSKNHQSEDNTDFFAELDKRPTKSTQNAAANDLFAQDNSSDPSAVTRITSTVDFSTDTDFGDFSSFKTAPGAGTCAKPSTLTPSPKPANQSKDSLFDTFTLPSPFATLPQTAPTAMTATITSSAAPFQPQKLLSAVSNFTSDQQIGDKTANASTNFGKTWSDLGVFNLDIDFTTLNKDPTKIVPPSLSQLQSIKRTPSTTHPMPSSMSGATFTTGSSACTMMKNDSNFAVFK